MESWQFIQSPAGEWYWLCSNVISRETRESPSTFKTRMECVANAMNAGYHKLASGAAGTAKHHKAPAGAQPKRPHASGAQPKHRGPPAAEGPAAAKRAPRRNRNKSGKQNKVN
jgi:hypothetical protein